VGAPRPGNCRKGRYASAAAGGVGPARTSGHHLALASRRGGKQSLSLKRKNKTADLHGIGGFVFLPFGKSQTLQHISIKLRYRRSDHAHQLENPPPLPQKIAYQPRGKKGRQNKDDLYESAVLFVAEIFIFFKKFLVYGCVYVYCIATIRERRRLNANCREVSQKTVYDFIGSDKKIGTFGQKGTNIGGRDG
jgi:hypothetical protein